jgi:hypothetical protein
MCEKYLMLDPQGNQVQRNSQGEIGLYWKFRSCLATVNGSKGQRDRWCRVACDDKTTACL